MYVEQTQTGLLAIYNLTPGQAEIIIEALVMYKSELDAHEFKEDRESCIEMFHELNSKLIQLREKTTIKAEQPCQQA